MNCLPTGKILSGKSKNKYSLSASQKYEQRIKDTKQKQCTPLIGSKFTKPEVCECNPCLDEWISKRKEIDKWRKSVLYALQYETGNSSSSSVVTDSQTRADSPTLTTSNTLCSAGEAHKKKMFNNPEPIFVGADEKLCRVPKSPSIPLFHSNSKTPIDGTTSVNNAAIFCDFYRQHNNDSAISIVDDDEVFVPIDQPPTSRYVSYGSNTLASTQSSFPKFADAGTNNASSNGRRNEININRKYTPQPIKKPLYLPLHNYNQFPDYYNEGFYDTKYMNQKSQPENSTNKHGASICYKSPSNQVNHFPVNTEPLSPCSKKTLHKTETNAKLVLRQSNSHFNSDLHHLSPFQRTMSLNIKRSPQIQQLPPPQTMLRGIDRRIDNNFPTRDVLAPSSRAKIERNNYDNVNETFFNQRYSNNVQHKLIMLKPTFSNENIFYPIHNREAPNYPIAKISSFNNLQAALDQIPKVSINEPLTMKFVFGSEPSLLRNF